jgi:hypothetical protein
MNISAASRLTTQMVPTSARRAADGDGDGLTGVAALNDGDAASTKARAAASASPPAQAPAAPAARTAGTAGAHHVDVRA